MRTHHPIVRRSGVLLLALAFALPAGCRNRQRPGRDYQPGPDRIAEAERLSSQAERAMQRGRKDEAMALYRQSITASPQLAVAWHNYGVLLLEQKNYIDAVEAFKAAADLTPTDGRPYYMIGVAYHQQGWDEQALWYFNRALERQPNHILSLRGAVRAGKRLDLADRAALDRAKRAVALEPDDTWRQIAQREALRIEGVMKQDQSRIELGGPVAAPGPQGAPAQTPEPAPAAPGPQ